MAWAVTLPDGSMSEPFDTAAEAEAFAETITEHRGRTPEEIYDSEARPRVDRAVFLRRMATGWKPHRALYTSMGGRYLGVTGVGPERQARVIEALGGRDAVLHEMWGRKRTVRDWSLSSRVPEDSIRQGIKRHGSLQAYFTHIGWYPNKPAEPMDLSDDKFYRPEG